MVWGGKKGKRFGAPKDRTSREKGRKSPHTITTPSSQEREKREGTVVLLLVGWGKRKPGSLDVLSLWRKKKKKPLQPCALGLEGVGEPAILAITIEGKKKRVGEKYVGLNSKDRRTGGKEEVLPFLPYYLRAERKGRGDQATHECHCW